jgi:hypothetical protein
MITTLTILDWHETHQLPQDIIVKAEEDAVLWHQKFAETIEIWGDILERQKAALPHGAFIDYCEHRLGIKQQKASELMRASRTLKRDSERILRKASLRALAKLAEANEQQLQQAIVKVRETNKLSVDDAAGIMGHAGRNDQATIEKAVQEALKKQRIQDAYDKVVELCGNILKYNAAEKLVDAGIPVSGYVPDFTWNWKGLEPKPWQTIAEVWIEAIDDNNYLARRASEALVAIGEDKITNETTIQDTFMVAEKLHKQLGKNHWWGLEHSTWVNFITQPERSYEIWWCVHTDNAGKLDEDGYWINSNPDDWFMPEDWDCTVVPDKVQQEIADGIEQAKQWRLDNA